MAEEHVVQSSYPDLDIPEDLSLPEAVLTKANTYGDRTVFIDDTTGRDVTFTQFVSDCYKLAAGLYHHGLNKGDVVAIHSDNSLEYPVIFLAVNLCGAVITGIRPAFDESSLKQVLTNCDPRYVFTTNTHVERTKDALTDCPSHQEIILIGETPSASTYMTYERLLDNDLEPPTISINNRTDPALITYTSGTTGVKKGVVSPHWTLLGGVTIMERYPDISFYVPGDVILMCRTMTHTYGQVAFVTGGPAMGVTSILLKDESVESIFKAVEKYKVTVHPFTPLPMAQWTKFDDAGKYDTSSMRCSMVAGSPLPLTIQTRFNEIFNLPRFIQGYGMSETGMGTMTPASYDKNGTSVGVLPPNVTAKVVDIDTLESLGPGKRGEIWIKSPMIMLYYLKLPAETENTLTPDGYVRSGDIGYYDDDGYFYIVDRLKEIIKYDIVKLAPAAIEAVLLEHPDILEVGVVGYPDEDYGELPRAYMVTKPGSSLTAEDVHNFLSGKGGTGNNLMSLPGGVVFRDSLPKTSIGKVMRKTLRQQMMADIEREKSSPQTTDL